MRSAESATLGSLEALVALVTIGRFGKQRHS